ncbi:MAG: ATP-dependent Clp protease ATP-binding subunit [Verrucomicrobia bacterium]|nr:ATP-dependent Clp protease ATP-binding subunit [Verrucomicrobiota bacterium]
MKHGPAINLVWQIAAQEAVAARSQFIEPEHFLAALTKLGQLRGGEAIEKARVEGMDISVLRPEMELVAGVLEDAEIGPDVFRRELRKRLGRGNYKHAEKATIHRSDRSRSLFQNAERIAHEMSASQVSAGHLFLAILEEKDSPGCKFLIEKGANLTSLADKARQAMGRVAEKIVAGPQPGGEKEQESPGTPFLDRFGRDLTKEAAEGKLGPFIGRRKEILRVIQTLARRSKNNPVLVGEAGVGKTAIVEAVAVRASAGKDARILGGKRIVELSMTSLVGGTKCRGEFEERLTRIIEECRSHPEVILFIDELHTVIGAGRAEGSMDAANILKPALARGDVRCIGATTIAEYRRYVESDPALERRFEKVLVPEPTRDEALDIVKGLRPKWEEHHGVRITDEAIEAAVDLAIRFDCDHQLPDKAIDLLDKAGAATRVPFLSMRPAAPRAVEPAGEPAKAVGPAGTVTELTVARILSEKMGLPLEVITGHLEGMSRSRLLEMESFLKKRVMGQDEAVERLCQRLLMAHAGLTHRRGPLGVFLFLGPTGVGKTELARSVTLFLFGSENDMIRLDMSEFMEEHSVAKLVGSPPGYVGHEEEGQLTGRLRSRPYAVVLLDEIEKAHPRVFDLFLQVFDEGRLTDAKGRTADARNAIFIMTSNITAEKHLGFDQKDTIELRGRVLREVKNRFRAEFINRIDEQIVFRPLAMEAVQAILGQMVNDIQQAFLNKYGKPLHLTGKVIEFLAARGYSHEFGVRHLRRTLQELVEVPLSKLVLSGELQNWSGVVVTVKQDQVCLQPK